MTETELRVLLEGVAVPFWRDWAFWIGTGLGVLGVMLSGFAFVEARQAKIAARQAGRVVKLQTIVVELTEVALRLERFDDHADFRSARNLLTETTRRVRRLIAPFQDSEAYRASCDELKGTMARAKEELAKLRPGGPDEAANTVYFALQEIFTDLGAQIAEIIGRFESETLDTSDEQQSRQPR